MTVWRDLFDRATLVFAFYFSKTITLSQSAPLQKLWPKSTMAPDYHPHNLSIFSISSLRFFLNKSR
jgi:hypothetical protein